MLPALCGFPTALNLLYSLLALTRKFTDKLDYVRPLIRLRSNKKVKFKKVLKRNYQLYLKSPMARGIKIWETLTAEMQKATTKVKFKNMIKPLCYY